MVSNEDLWKAIQQNEELKQREARLLEERDLLASRIKLNSISAADVNKELLITLNDVSRQRKTNNTERKAMDIAHDMNDFITASLSDTKSSYESSLNELNSLTEQLSTVDYNDLLAELIEAKLNVAEQDEIINELSIERTNLETEIQHLQCQETMSVRQFQEEYMEYKIKEARAKKEFESIKKDLAKLKNEIDMTKSASETNEEDEEPFSIRFKLWPSDAVNDLKIQSEFVTEHTNDLVHEKEKLRQKIEHLSRTLEDLKHASNFRIRLLAELADKLKNIQRKSEDVEEKTMKIMKENEQLTETYQTNLSGITESIEEKDRVIQELSDIISDMKGKLSEIPKSDIEERSVNDLQQLIKNLEDEIKIYHQN